MLNTMLSCITFDTPLPAPAAEGIALPLLLANMFGSRLCDIMLLSDVMLSISDRVNSNNCDPPELLSLCPDDIELFDRLPW